MTREHFTIQIGRLIVLRNWPDDDTEWWNALRDVDPAVFEAGVDHALKTRTFFPLPAELRVDCEAVRVRVKPPQPAYPNVEDLPETRVLEIPNPFGGPPLRITITREWRHDCDICWDSGWAPRWCGEASGAREWQTVTACGRRKEHIAHEFVEPCACMEWNPTIRRRKEAGMKYAQGPERVGA